ncbi:formin domain-containing protein [Toxoplasma gondii GT1]|uniref:Formin domain-containing protein n=1 Tax=Toxoplasma gondii (strain ATCC 50853 / GT1) TaxID=507601 RepID=S7W2S6_TOXGG|nr:formin domain-containing protein [Toxoplasma gondii GT1]
MPPPPPPPKGKKGPLPKKASNSPLPPKGKSSPDEGAKKTPPPPPAAKAGVPEGKAEMPSEKADVPQKKAGVPSEKADVPQKKAGLPKEKAEVPQKKAGLPKEKAGIPQEKAGISKGESGSPEGKTGPLPGKAGPPKGKLPPGKAPPAEGSGPPAQSDLKASPAGAPPSSLPSKKAVASAGKPLGGKTPPAPSVDPNPPLGSSGPQESGSSTYYRDTLRAAAGTAGGIECSAGEASGETVPPPNEAYAAKAAMMVESLKLADYTNVPAAHAHGTEPPALPFAPGADRNPAILTRALKKEMELRRGQPTQTPEERRLMLAGTFSLHQARLGFKLSPEHQRVAEALMLLRRLEDFRGSVQAGEVQRIRYLLRVGATEAFSQQRYSDAMLQALHSYLLAKSYYTAYQSAPLEGEMVPELLLLVKCCGLAGCPDRGQEYLKELRYIVENTLIAEAGGSAAGNRGSLVGPIMRVEKHVLASVVSSLAELCSLYNQPDDARLFYEKYVILTKDVYGADSLAVSDALNTVALYFFRTRQYGQALPLVEQVLAIRKKHLGDFDAAEPHARVADCYANIGLLHRLLGHPTEAFPCVLIALDMRMRIYQTRETSGVQDLVLALGCLQHQAGHFRAALEAYKEVWTFRNNTLGVTHPDTVNVELLLRQLEKDLAAQMQEDKQRFVQRDKALPSASAFDLTTRASSQISVSRQSHRPGDFFYEEADGAASSDRGRRGSLDFADASATVRLLKPAAAATLEAYRQRHAACGSTQPLREKSHFHSVARVRALYGEEWRSLMVPSAAILPYVDVEVTGPDTLKLAECFQFQEALAVDRPTLPVVNVPQIERGEAVLEQGHPHMVLSPDAAELLSQWGVALPEVDEKGQVINREAKLEKHGRLFLPLVDPSTNQPFLGFYGEPVMVPNPAVYHSVIAPAILAYARRQAALVDRAKNAVGPAQKQRSAMVEGAKQVARGVVMAKLGAKGKAGAKTPAQDAPKGLETKDAPATAAPATKEGGAPETAENAPPKVEAAAAAPDKEESVEKKEEASPSLPRKVSGLPAKKSLLRSKASQEIPKAPPLKDDSSAPESGSDSGASDRKRSPSLSTKKSFAKKTSAALPTPAPEGATADGKPKSLLGSGAKKFDPSAYKAKVKAGPAPGKALSFRATPKHAAALPPSNHIREAATLSDPDATLERKQKSRTKAQTTAADSHELGRNDMLEREEEGDGGGEEGLAKRKKVVFQKKNVEKGRKVSELQHEASRSADGRVGKNQQGPAAGRHGLKAKKLNAETERNSESEEKSSCGFAAPQSSCTRKREGSRETRCINVESVPQPQEGPDGSRDTTLASLSPPDSSSSLRCKKESSKLELSVECSASRDEPSEAEDRREENRREERREKTRRDFKALLLKKQREHMSETLMRLQKETDREASESASECKIFLKMQRSLERKDEAGLFFPRASGNQTTPPAFQRASWQAAALAGHLRSGDSLWTRGEETAEADIMGRGDESALLTRRVEEEGKRVRERLLGCDIRASHRETSLGADSGLFALDREAQRPAENREFPEPHCVSSSPRKAIDQVPDLNCRAALDPERKSFSPDSDRETSIALCRRRVSPSGPVSSPDSRWRGDRRRNASSRPTLDWCLSQQGNATESSSPHRDTTSRAPDSPHVKAASKESNFLSMPFLAAAAPPPPGLFSPWASPVNSDGNGDTEGTLWDEGIEAGGSSLTRRTRSSERSLEKRSVRQKAPSQVSEARGTLMSSLNAGLEATKTRADERRDIGTVFCLSDSRDTEVKPGEETLFQSAAGESWGVDRRYVEAEREAEQRRRRRTGGWGRHEGTANPGGRGRTGSRGEASTWRRESTSSATEAEIRRERVEQSRPDSGRRPDTRERKRSVAQGAVNRVSIATGRTEGVAVLGQERRRCVDARRRNEAEDREGEVLGEAELSVSCFDSDGNQEKDFRRETSSEEDNEEDGEEAELFSTNEVETDTLRSGRRKQHAVSSRSASPSPWRVGADRTRMKTNSQASAALSGMRTSRFLQPPAFDSSASRSSSASPSRRRRLETLETLDLQKRTRKQRARVGSRESREGNAQRSPGNRRRDRKRQTEGRRGDWGRAYLERLVVGQETETDSEIATLDEELDRTELPRVVSPQTFHEAPNPFSDQDTETDCLFSTPRLPVSNADPQASKTHSEADEYVVSFASQSSAARSSSCYPSRSPSCSALSLSFACSDSTVGAESATGREHTVHLLRPTSSSVSSISPTSSDCGRLDSELDALPGLGKCALFFSAPEAVHARPLASPSFRQRLFSRRDSGAERASCGDAFDSWSPTSAGAGSRVVESCGSNVSSPSRGRLRSRVSLGGLKAAFSRHSENSSNERLCSPRHQETSRKGPLAVARRLSGVASRLVHSRSSLQELGEAEDDSRKRSNEGDSQEIPRDSVGVTALTGDSETPNGWAGVGGLDVSAGEDSRELRECEEKERERTPLGGSLRRFSFSSDLRKDPRRPGRTLSDATATCEGDGKMRRLVALLRRKNRRVKKEGEQESERERRDEGEQESERERRDEGEHEGEQESERERRDEREQGGEQESENEQEAEHESERERRDEREQGGEHESERERRDEREQGGEQESERERRDEREQGGEQESENEQEAEQENEREQAVGEQGQEREGEGEQRSECEQGGSVINVWRQAEKEESSGKQLSKGEESREGEKGGVRAADNQASGATQGEEQEQSGSSRFSQLLEKWARMSGGATPKQRIEMISDKSEPGGRWRKDMGILKDSEEESLIGKEGISQRLTDADTGTEKTKEAQREGAWVVTESAGDRRRALGTTVSLEEVSLCAVGSSESHLEKLGSGGDENDCGRDASEETKQGHCCEDRRSLKREKEVSDWGVQTSHEREKQVSGRGVETPERREELPASALSGDSSSSPLAGSASNVFPARKRLFSSRRMLRLPIPSRKLRKADKPGSPSDAQNSAVSPSPSFQLSQSAEAATGGPQNVAEREVAVLSGALEVQTEGWGVQTAPETPGNSTHWASPSFHSLFSRRFSLRDRLRRRSSASSMTVLDMEENKSLDALSVDMPATEPQRPLASVSDSLVFSEGLSFSSCVDPVSDFGDDNEKDGVTQETRSSCSEVPCAGARAAGRESPTSRRHSFVFRMTQQKYRTEGSADNRGRRSLKVLRRSSFSRAFRGLVKSPERQILRDRDREEGKAQDTARRSESEREGEKDDEEKQTGKREGRKLRHLSASFLRIPRPGKHETNKESVCKRRGASLPPLPPEASSPHGASRLRAAAASFSRLRRRSQSSVNRGKKEAIEIEKMEEETKAQNEIKHERKSELKQEEVDEMKQENVDEIKQERKSELKQEEVDEMKQENVDEIKQERKSELKQEEVDEMKQENVDEIKQERKSELKQEEVDEMKQENVDEIKQETPETVPLWEPSITSHLSDSCGEDVAIFAVEACVRAARTWQKEDETLGASVAAGRGEDEDECVDRGDALTGQDDNAEETSQRCSCSEDSPEGVAEREWMGGSSDGAEIHLLPEADTSDEEDEGEEEEGEEEKEEEGEGEEGEEEEEEGEEEEEEEEEEGEEEEGEEDIHELGEKEDSSAEEETRIGEAELRHGVAILNPFASCGGEAYGEERPKTGTTGSEADDDSWAASDWSVGASSSDEESERSWQEGPSSEEDCDETEAEKNADSEVEELYAEKLCRKKVHAENDVEECKTEASKAEEGFQNSMACLAEVLRLTGVPYSESDLSVEIAELNRQSTLLMVTPDTQRLSRELPKSIASPRTSSVPLDKQCDGKTNLTHLPKSAPFQKAMELTRVAYRSGKTPAACSVLRSSSSSNLASSVSSSRSSSKLVSSSRLYATPREPRSEPREASGGFSVSPIACDSSPFAPPAAPLGASEGGRESLSCRDSSSVLVGDRPPRFSTQQLHALPPKGPKGGPPKKGKATGWKPPPPLPPAAEDGTDVKEGPTVLKQGIFKKAEQAVKKEIPKKEEGSLKEAAKVVEKKVLEKKASVSAAKGETETKVAVKSVAKPPPLKAAKSGEAKTAEPVKEEAKVEKAPKVKGDGFSRMKLPSGKPEEAPKKTPKMKIMVGTTGQAKVVEKKDTMDELDAFTGPCYIPPHMDVPPVAPEVLAKITKLKPGVEKDPQLGELPVVILMDDNNTELARLPWQVDISSFSLAQSSMSILVARRLGLLARRLDEDKKDEDTRDWLTGEGLKKFGLSMQKEKPTFGDTSLLLGMGLSALPQALAQKKPEAPKKEEAKPKPEAKKEAPKKGPPGGKGGKGPPGKGPPKGKGKGPKKKGEGGLKVGKKDEGKTKRFFWDPIFEDEIPGTIFMKKPNMVLKLQDVEETFAKVVAKKKTESKKPKIIQLLPDSKRAYNMSIALSKFNNYSYQQLREAIIDLDPKILTIEATETLLNFVPTGEENQVVKEYINSGGDLKLVDKPEQFVAAMLGVPLMKQRLEAHAFALNFREAYSDAYTPLENMADACDAIDDSQNLKIVLFAILELGNALNEGDPQRGGAAGFKPTTLAKLQEIRTTTKPVRTMLQYICDIIWEQQPTALNIYEDLKICDKAQRVDMQGIEGRISNLKAGLTKVKNTLEAAKKGNESTGVMGDRDPLRNIMDEFLIEAEPKIKQLDDFLVQVQNQFLQTCHYSGYPDKDVKKIKPDELFKQVAGFARQVDAIRKQKQEIADRELKRKEAEAKRAGKGLKSTAVKKVGMK